MRHLHRILHRTLRLHFQAGSSAIPKLSREVHRVEHGWRIASSGLTVHPGRKLAAIGESVIGVMAGSTGNCVVHRKDGIVVELAAKGNRFGGWWVIGWRDHRRQTERG